VNGELRVVKSGLLTTIQDLGRWGSQARGVPVAGPMDPRSHRLANAIVANDLGAALLEITLIGPELLFGDERIVAVAGAQFELTIDGRSVPCGVPLAVSAGSTFRFGQRVRGSRAYLAISGGIAVEPQLGSRATHLGSRLGGADGRALGNGDRLPLGVRPDVASQLDARRSVQDMFSIPDRHAGVRVLPGPHHDRFADHAIDVLQSAPYSIGTESDRMGFRLRGPILERRPGADIISDVTPLGVLQVPASGQPVLLMADRQTTGGYPMIATVITADIGLAGQLGPGDTISFEVCSRQEALTALIAQERALLAVEGAVRP
jgi:antagonist of KipI